VPTETIGIDHGMLSRKVVPLDHIRYIIEQIV